MFSVRTYVTYENVWYRSHVTHENLMFRVRTYVTYRRDMTEKLWKATLNPNKQQHYATYKKCNVRTFVIHE